MVDREFGRIANVVEAPIRTALLTDAAAGVRVLEVQDASPFPPGSWVLIGDQVVLVAAHEPDPVTGPDTVTLAADLDVDADAEDWVTRWNPGKGKPFTRRVAMIQDEGDVDPGDAIEVPLRHALRSQIPEGIRVPGMGERVEIEFDEQLQQWRLVDVDDEAPEIDPDTIATPYCFGTLLADTTIPDDTWTLLTGWLSFKNDFTATFVTPGSFFVDKTALYHVEFGVRWRSNATGRRACKSMRYTILGDFDQFTDSRGAEATAAMSTLSVSTVPLHPGDQVTFWVYQNSGAGLDIIGGETTFAIARSGS